MGIIAYADQNIIEKLNCVAANESFSIGLVIAQKGSEHIYITHLAPLPSPIEDETEESPDEKEIKEKQSSQKPTSLLSVTEQLLSTHASQVIRMVPGGLDVLGVYVTTPVSELNSSAAQGKLRAILTTIHKATSKYYLGTRESSLEKIILFHCTQTLKTGVKSFDLSEQGTSPVTGTLKTQETKWIQLNYNYSLSYPIYFPKEKSSQSLSKIVLTAFRPWAQSLPNTLILIDGKVYGEDDELVSIEEKSPKKKGGKEPAIDSVFQALDVQILQNQNPPESTNISEFQECSGSILFKGTVAGRAFLNAKASAAEAFAAVRTDLIRSIVSRWEMHCDSLVEEPHGSSAHPVLHEPPRRVFLKGGTSPISLCDYLFPGDYACDACESAKEILDLNIFEDDVQDSVEKWADPEEFRPPETHTSSYTNDKGYGEISSVKNSSVLQLLTAILIAVLSLILCYFLSTSKR